MAVWVRMRAWRRCQSSRPITAVPTAGNSPAMKWTGRPLSFLTAVTVHVWPPASSVPVSHGWPPPPG